MGETGNWGKGVAVCRKGQRFKLGRGVETHRWMHGREKGIALMIRIREREGCTQMIQTLQTAPIHIPTPNLHHPPTAFPPYPPTTLVLRS